MLRDVQVVSPTPPPGPSLCRHSDKKQEWRKFIFLLSQVGTVDKNKLPPSLLFAPCLPEPAVIGGGWGNVGRKEKHGAPANRPAVGGRPRSRKEPEPPSAAAAQPLPSSTSRRAVRSPQRQPTRCWQPSAQACTKIYLSITYLKVDKAVQFRVQFQCRRGQTY